MWQISVVAGSATVKLLQLIQSHICISVLLFSVLWTSVFLWRFGDNKNVLLFPTTLLHIRISFSDKLGLKFTVSQQFTSNFFRLQVLHYICKVVAHYKAVFFISAVKNKTSDLHTHKKKKKNSQRRCVFKNICFILKTYRTGLHTSINFCF